MADTGLLAAATRIVTEATQRDPWLSSLRLAGIGWATVELERAAEELGSAFDRAGMPAPDWTPARRDEHLGAAAWVSREWWPAWGSDDPPAVLVLEPDTEGRLAAALARFGEGVAAVYVAPGPGGGSPVAARLGAPASGPLGNGRLLLARPAWGPHVVVLAR